MMYKPLLFVLGLLFVGLAIVGIFLPVLPTTPLLLLALACFAKSSQKLHTWLLRHKTFGPLIRQWHETRSIPRKAKIIAIMTIFMSGVATMLTVDLFKLKLAVLVLLIIPVIIILNIRTSEPL